MRRLALAVVLSGLLVPLAQAQNMDLYDLYQKRDLQGCLDGALPRLAQSPNDRDLNHLVGRCLVEIGRPGEARPYLENVVKGVGPKDWRYAFSLLNLGLVQWWEEDREGTRLTWTIAATDPKLSTVSQSAAFYLARCGLAEDYAAFGEMAGERVHCLFAPNVAGSDREAFLRHADETWARLAAFFGGEPDRGGDIVVWTDAGAAQQVVQVPTLGYSYPDLCVVHTLLDSPLGRDLTPVFVRWVSRPTEPVRFIVDGAAEVCDGRAGVDRLAEARAALAAAQITAVDVPRWWQDHLTLPASALRPVSGAFVQMLLDRGGREKLLQLLHQPTFVHAWEVYGREDLQAIIDAFTVDLQAG